MGSPIFQELERKLARGALHADPTQFGKFLQRSLAAEPAPTTILHPTQRHLWLIMNRLIIDVVSLTLFLEQG